MRVTAGRAAGSTWVGVTGCRLSRWRLAATAAVAVLVGVAAWAGTARAALPSNCSETGGTVTCTFSETGGSQSWTVPSGLASATFVVDGAAGSPSADDLTPSGLGGQVSATMGSLTAGQVFTIEVGGAGSVNGPGGFNGGGSAGADGGAGGGFSSVSLGSTVELVAGGGGGGGMVGFSFETCGFSNVAGGPGGAGGQVGVDGTGGGSTSCSTETLGPGGGGNAGGDTVNPARAARPVQRAGHRSTTAAGNPHSISMVSKAHLPRVPRAARARRAAVAAAAGTSAVVVAGPARSMSAVRGAVRVAAAGAPATRRYPARRLAPACSRATGG